MAQAELPNWSPLDKHIYKSILVLIREFFRFLWMNISYIYHVCLYCCLTAWCRIFLETLLVPKPVKKFPLIFCNQQIHYRIHKRPFYLSCTRSFPFNAILSQFNICFNNILPTIPMCSKWYLCFRFPHQTLLCPSPVHATCNVHPLLLYVSTLTVV